MELLVNCYTFPPAESGGGGAVKYTQAMLRTLAKELEITAIVSPTNKEDYNIPGVDLLSVGELRGDHSVFSKNDMVFFNPSNVLTPIDLPTTLPTVSLLHDYQHLLHPEWHSKDGVASRNAEYCFAVQRSDIMVCISDFEAGNLKKFYGSEHGRVVYHAPFLFEWAKTHSSAAGKTQRNNNSASFYLYPAVPWVHKNHINLLSAFDQVLSNNDTEFDSDLVLTGFNSSDQNVSSLMNFIKNMKNAHRVHVKGHVTDRELAHLMEAGKGLLFPSIYEGFGIPIVDAMAFELPVLSVKETAVPEIAGDAIDYFQNPRNARSMAGDIMEFDRRIDTGEYNIQNAKEKASEYSVERMARELMDVFQEARELVDGKTNIPARSIKLYPSTETEVPKPVCFIVDCVFSKRPDEKTMLKLQKTIGKYEVAFVVSVKSDAASMINKYFPEAVIVVSDGHQADHGVLLQNLVHMNVNSQYVYYIIPDELDGLNERDILTGISLLENWKDLFSVNFLGHGYPVIRRPAPEEAAIPRYNDLRSKGLNKWLKHFSGRLFRKEQLLDKGAPGSLTLLSADFLLLSNVEI